MTTTDELKAAAERILDRSRPHYECWVQSDNDECSVAVELLKRLAADEQQAKEDAEPIKWNEAESQQFANGIRVECWYDSKVVVITQTEDTIDGIEDSCIVTKIKTRGQLRKLLESLEGGGS